MASVFEGLPLQGPAAIVVEALGATAARTVEVAGLFLKRYTIAALRNFTPTSRWLPL